jgi:hypothetical protein
MVWGMSGGGLQAVRVCKWLNAVGAAVVIFHALLIAFTPTELLLLAEHTHITEGHVTPQEWEEHLRHHLKQARDYLVGIHTHDIAGLPGTPSTKIFSAPGGESDAQNTASLAEALLPFSLSSAGRVSQVRGRVGPFVALDRSPRHDVPRRPPRNLP